MNSKRLTQLVIVLFTIILLSALLSQISISDLARAFSSISLKVLVVCFILYSVVNVVRAARFSVMLKKTGGLYNFYKIVCVHNLANNLMPFKTGELAFVYLAKSRLNLSAGIGVVTVVIARLYDSIAVCILFVLALAMLGENTRLFADVTPVMVSLAVFLSLAVVGFMWYSHVLVGILGKIPDIIVFKRNIVKFFRLKAEEVSGYYSSRESKASIPLILALSLIIWAMNSALMYILISNLGISLNMWLIIIGALVSVILSVLPIHGIGQFGTSELIWSGIFIAFGITKEAAISSGLMIHLVILSFSVVLGLYALTEEKILSYRVRTSLKQ
jgi:uncharacterized protein (TIRG00374 family)